MSTNLKKSSATQSRKRDGPKERLKQTVKDCLERYQHWQKLYEDGGSDPFYTDGANLALVRNHIIYYKKQMEEACLALACELPDVYFRALPPEVPAGYMAKPDEIRQAARETLAAYEKDEDYLALLRVGKQLSPKQKEKTGYLAAMGYVTRLKSALESDDLVTLRLYRRTDVYADAIKECRKRVDVLELEPYQMTLFDIA